MMETKNNDIFFNEQFLSNYVSTIACKGFMTTKYLNVKQIDVETIETYTSDLAGDGQILDALTHKARPLADGAELTQVRGSVPTGEAMDLEMYGFEYKVTPKLEKSRGYSLEKDLRDLAYTLGVLIEGKNMSVLLENAKAPKVPAADLKGNWASADLKDIQADIIEMQDAYDQTDYQYDLNGLFYNRREYKALRKHMNNSVEKYDIEKIAGMLTALKQPIFFEEAFHHNINKELNAGTVLGFDLNFPPATCYYAVQEGTTNTITYEGMESCAPIIRTYTKEKKGIAPYKTIEFGACFGMHVDNPAAVFKQTGL